MIQYRHLTKGFALAALRDDDPVIVDVDRPLQHNENRAAELPLMKDGLSGMKTELVSVANDLSGFCSDTGIFKLKISINSGTMPPISILFGRIQVRRIWEALDV